MSCIPLALLLPVALGFQTPPPDPIPAPPGHDFGLRWGGEIRQLEALQTPSGLNIWTAEPGGRIRHSSDTGVSWAFQAVPEDAHQTLLDVWFEDTLCGWACGRAGRLLRTTDGGATWNHYDPVNRSMPDSAGFPSTLWRVRWVNDDVGFVAGLDTLKRTDQGVSGGVPAWQDVKLWWSEAEVDVNASQGSILPRDVEFYSLEILKDTQDAQRFVGLAAGDIWSTHPVRALAFRTDTSSPKSDGGRNWWVALDVSNLGSTMVNPWDIEFESIAGDPDALRGYLVGGTGNQDGSIFTTADGGSTWVEENAVLLPPPGDPWFVPTIYGVAAMPGGQALACGYGGSIWWRDQATGLWYWRPADGLMPPLPSIMPPLPSIEAATGNRALLGGSFGMFRATVDSGLNWQISMNPIYGPSNPERNWRFENILFFDESNGFAIGQFQLILRTSDGGLTWTRIQGGFGEPDNKPTTNLVSMAFRDDQVHGVVASANTNLGADLLQYTTDGGNTWSPATVPALTNPKLKEVEHGGGSVFWAVGSSANSPLVLYSSDHGQSWIVANAPTATNAKLTAASFVSAFDGIVVGNVGKKAKAWRSDVSTGQLVWVDISPVAGPAGTESRKLLDVEERGTDLATAEVYAVGESGAVFRFDPAASSFGQMVDVPAVYDIEDDGDLFSRWMRVDLKSVALAPGGQEILIGPADMKHDRNTTDWKEFAEDLGQVLRFNGAIWEKVGCMTTKDARAICLVGDGAGYLLGQLGQLGSHGGSELGTVGDCILLRYDKQ